MALVQSVTSTASNTGTPASLSLSVSHGNTLVLIVSLGNRTQTAGVSAPPPPTDSTGQTWQLATGPASVASGTFSTVTTQCAIYYLNSARSGTHVVTPGTSLTGTYWDLTLAEFTPCYALDVTQTATNTTGATTLSTGFSALSSGDAEFVIAALSVGSNTGIANAGFTDPASFTGGGGVSLNVHNSTTNGNGGEHAYKTTLVESAVQQASWSWTTGAADVAMAVLASFKNGTKGQFAESNLGTIAAKAITVSLVGASIALSQGVLTPNSSGVVPLTGQAATGQQQTIAPSWGQALTGSAITSARGTVLMVSNPTTSDGLQITSATGAVSAASNSVTANISGVEATFQQGNVAGGYTVISGSAMTGGQGSTAQSLTVPISGAEVSVLTGAVAPDQQAVDTQITSSSGSVAQSRTIALSGAVSTGAQGAFTVSGDEFFALSGSASTTSAGTLAPDKQFALSGIQASMSQGAFGAPGGAALSGSQITSAAGQVFLTSDRSAAVTGQSMTAQSGLTFASSLAFVTGQMLVSDQSSLGPRGAVLTGQAVVSGAGTLGVVGDVVRPLTGQSSTFSTGSITTQSWAPMVGQTITAAQSQIGAPSVARLTGQSMTAASGHLAPPGVFTSHSRGRIGPPKPRVNSTKIGDSRQ